MLLYTMLQTLCQFLSLKFECLEKHIVSVFSSCNSLYLFNRIKVRRIRRELYKNDLFKYISVALLSKVSLCYF